MTVTDTMSDISWLLPDKLYTSLRHVSLDLELDRVPPNESSSDCGSLHTTDFQDQSFRTWSFKPQIEGIAHKHPRSDPTFGR